MKWEYFVDDLTPSNMEMMLNSYGQDGWELVSVIDNGNKTATVFFKRPIKEKQDLCFLPDV